MSQSWKPTDATLPLELRAAADGEQDMLMLRVSAALRACACFLHTEEVTSAGNWTLHFETTLDTILEVYSTLQSVGLDLSRNSHEQLTSLCILQKHPQLPYKHRLINAELSVHLEHENEFETTLTGFA